MLIARSQASATLVARQELELGIAKGVRRPQLRVFIVKPVPVEVDNKIQGRE